MKSRLTLGVVTAKVQAVLRRAYSLQGVVNRMEYGGLVLNLGDATVEFGGERLELTKNEFPHPADPDGECGEDRSQG